MPSDTPSASARRYPTAALVGAGLGGVLLGVVLGAIIAFAITSLTFKVRVELPPPPYPQLSSTPSVSAPLPALPHP